MENLVEEYNISDVKKTKKPFWLKMIWSQIKLGWKIMPKQQLVGGIVGGGFFLFGVGHFLWYMYLLILAYPVIGHILLILLGLFILLVIVSAIVRKIKDVRYKKKMKKIYQKIADHTNGKDNNNPDLGQNLITE